MELFRSTGSYEPDRQVCYKLDSGWWFRSTGSYEPDLLSYRRFEQLTCFDPQALTSLTLMEEAGVGEVEVSIHRLLRA